MTSEVQTELSVQVVLPNGESKALRVLVDFGCQAVALANPNVFGDQISEKYESPQRRRLLQANNETPLLGGDEQIDVKIQLTGVVDGSVSLPRVAQYGVSPYLVPNLPWDMVLGDPWGYEHCVSHFARFNCLYSHHPVHLSFWIEDFGETPRTGKPFLVKPIHGKVSRKSVWGITVPIIGAVTPVHPAPAIVVTPPGGEPPNRAEAEKHISYALTASSVAPVQDRACALELVEFAPETLARDVLPARRDGSVWTNSDYGLTPYWAARVKKQFGKDPDVDAFNRVPGMAQATCWVSLLEDFFCTPADPSKLYWMCPSYHRFSDCVRKVRQETLVGKVANSPLPYRGSPPLQSAGEKSEVAHNWAKWLPHPCRIGDPHRCRAGGKIRSGPQVGKVATSPLPYPGSPPLQSGGQNQKWPTSGQSGYLTPCVSGIPTASERGAKSEVAHKWAKWLPDPCRIGDPHRCRAGGKMRSGP